MNVLYSFLLFLVSGGMYGYWYMNPGFDPSTKYWIQVYAALAGSVGLLAYEYLPKLKNIKSILPVKPSNPTPTVPDPEQIFQPQKFEEHDFSCLVHLRNRVQKANSKDGLATVEKLAAIIFSLGKKD